MNEYLVLIIGGNLGDRIGLLNKAKEQVIQAFGAVILASSVYETDAWGGVSSKSYLNQVLVFDLAFNPQFILQEVLSIEIKLGRERNERWGDRTMDIDILYMGQQIIEDENLTVPHPRISLRRFVLQPLVEILPDFIHPVYKKNHHELLANCDDLCKVQLFNID